jgi:hypothetical protein
MGTRQRREYSGVATQRDRYKKRRHQCPIGHEDRQESKRESNQEAEGPGQQMQWTWGGPRNQWVHPGIAKLGEYSRYEGSAVKKKKKKEVVASWGKKGNGSKYPRLDSAERKIL